MSIGPDYSDADIAVVGMSCHFPDAKNYSEFWKNLANGKESVTYFSNLPTTRKISKPSANGTSASAPCRTMIERVNSALK